VILVGLSGRGDKDVAQAEKLFSVAGSTERKASFA